MDKRNALRPSGETVEERFEAARRRNNYLREEPAEPPQPKWKFKARPTGGLKPNGAKASATLEF